MPKFNKKGGVLGEIIDGTGGLIIGVVLILIIISTILGANLLGSDATSTITVANETGAYINTTGYTLANVNASNSAYTLTALLNATDNSSIGLGNATLSAAGVLTNATATNWDDVLVSYTYVYSYDNSYELVSQRMSSNFTAGIDNVSGKIPTILLIAAVVILFGVLILLVKRAKEMSGGSTGTL